LQNYFKTVFILRVTKV